ncbi:MULTISPECIES: D-serine ammonia-lyase [Enterococcus]|uniref:Probable D-serine dehydratase n=1 Tax=Candidatus Enterococcus mangumiae TaxID=2230878 RepID=A0ABZ2SY15_9ENTE|nr:MULTISPECIES: D-serine ammonia-lyase [unclassified Enterococcus]MBO0491436.1 D-serine ammonia-lyase [Enterococcus sp. DIV1094]MBO1301010.1 D-serine ammonia-lyase [Enterococcus sp. DIV1271a]
MTNKTDRLLIALQSYQEVCWINPNFGERKTSCFTINDVIDASKRLQRFAPYIAKVFPETKATGGIIESELVEIPNMLDKIKEKEHFETNSKLYFKCDNNLPVSGSIKARGGIYEVLTFAEKVALDSGKLTIDSNYAILANDEFKNIFSNYSIAVGSTGNLGLSVGIMGAKLGFQTTVHMSNEAKSWKKRLLREIGVVVKEYEGDFSKAVALGRAETVNKFHSYFIDDEASKDLFLGYSVAALRLQTQLKEKNIEVSEDHPLYVHLPCGVGGSPGGIAFGLSCIFGDAVKIFFVEPTHAPSMLLGLYTGLHDKISVQDIAIDGKTAADGLAVGRPSHLVGKIIEPILYASSTVQDERLYQYLTLLADSENIYVEPSSAAGIASFVNINRAFALKKTWIKSGTHIIWGTGGNMVPEEEMAQYYKKGLSLLNF